MVVRIARLAIAAPGRIMALAALIMVATALFGGSVFSHLSAGGMHDPGSDSAQAARLLADKFDRGDMQMLVTVTSAAGTAAPAARAAGLDVVERLSRSPHVTYVMSPWTTPPGASATLVSRDGRTGLVVAGISGGESGAQRHARQLAERVVGDYDGVTVRAGGEATIYWQVNDQTRRDLLRMEALAMPLCFLVTVWVFGGLLAAALPMIIGGFAILGALAALHAISLVTEVSVFALNLTLAMGLGLGIDYTLLILSRLRDELAEGVSRDEALLRTMATAGRTVVFSAMTVALSVATMALFPQYFLKSFAYAGVAVVVFAALAAVVVTPAAVTLLGGWLDYLDVRHLVRRWIKRTEPQPKRVDQTFFYRSTRWVMRHAVPAGAAVLVLLGILGSPFLQVRWGVSRRPGVTGVGVGAPGRRIAAQRLCGRPEHRRDGGHPGRGGGGCRRARQLCGGALESARSGIGVGTERHVRRRKIHRTTLGTGRNRERQRIFDCHQRCTAVLACIRGPARGAARGSHPRWQNRAAGRNRS